MRWLVLVVVLVAARPAAADGVKKLDATHYQVAEKVIDAFLDHPKAFAKDARFVIAVKDRQPYGIKVYAIRPGSLFARIGFSNGDTLLTINGIQLTDVAAFSDALPKIANARTLELGLVRRGKPIALIITVN